MQSAYTYVYSSDFNQKLMRETPLTHACENTPSMVQGVQMEMTSGAEDKQSVFA
jgi:hypothetical protein